MRCYRNQRWKLTHLAAVLNDPYPSMSSPAVRAVRQIFHELACRAGLDVYWDTPYGHVYVLYGRTSSTELASLREKAIEMWKEGGRACA